MLPVDILFLSAAETARAIRAKELSPVEVTERYLERIERLNPRLHAYITVTEERALAEARAVEHRLMAGDTQGPLFGVPVAVKDQFWTKGIRTTCGSSAYKDFVPADDATVITRLREAGAILLGKLNLWLASVEEEPPPWGECRNPWDPDRLPGGSSTGSAVALATRLCGASVGEDTGGSGRIPASWSGVTGLRPTYGRVSRYGEMPMCWYLDIAAPMGRSVEDTALVLQAIGGYDPKDPYTSQRPLPSYTAALGKPVQGARIGIIQELTTEKVDPEVRRLIRDAVEVLEDLGADVREVSVPMIIHGGAIFNILALAEASSAVAEVLRMRPPVIRKAMRAWLWAQGLLPARLINDILKVRALLRRQLLDAFKSFDLLLSPTTKKPALGPEYYRTRGRASEDGITELQEWIAYVAGHALAAIPAISVPCGFTRAERPLPVGMQLAAPPFGEERLLQVAYAYQQATDWHKRRPPLD